MEEKDDYPITEARPLSRQQKLTNSRPWKFYQRHRLIVIIVVMLVLLLPLLGLLALRNRHSARAEWVSPAVQPSRKHTVVRSK
jgi:flagellar basal body-associated protein FliL